MRRWTWAIVATMLLAGTSGCFGASKAIEVAPRSTESTDPAATNNTGPAFAGGFSNTSVFPGTYKVKPRADDMPSYSLVLEPGSLKAGKEQLQTLTSTTPGPSGPVAIQVGYILPDGSNASQFPVIVVVSPYLSNLVVGSFRTAYNSNPVQTIPFLIDNYVPHGYAVAIVPVRGTAGNGGCYEWWGAHETADVKQAVEWIAGQPWSGNLGFFGLSLGGAGAWMAAGLGHPDVKTIVPSESEPDLYSWFVRNGTPSLVAAPAGTPAYWGVYSLSPSTYDGKGARAQSQIPGALCPEIATAIGASGQMATTGAPDTLGYVAARDLRPAVEKNYRGSILLLHGFNDFLAYPHLVHPWINELEARGLVVKQILGQWRHRLPDDPNEGPFFQPTLRVDFAEVLLRWFDYWLKGNTTIDLGPRVQVADNKNQWRNEEAWPPQDRIPTPFYPSGDNKLGPTKATDATKILAPDPRRSLTRVNATAAPQQNCPGCAYFETPPLRNDLRFAGLASLRVTAVPHGPAGQIAATLYAKQGTTYQTLTNAVMDLRFAGSSPVPYVTPNAPIVANLEFEPNDVIVPAGATLLLELGQYGYGDDAGLFIGQDGSVPPPVPDNKALSPAAYYRSAWPTNPVTVNLGGEKTFLTLPIIERTGAGAFAAPVAAK